VPELELIRAIQAAIQDRGGRTVRWTGDDAAVVRARALAVTSIDTVVDGVHFSLATHSPGDVGWKALATALSDIAAMGAEPGEAHVALALPRGFDAVDARALVTGMEALAERHGVSIAGGDVIAAESLTVTVCVTGWADDADALVGRDGAKPMDDVWITGEVGGAAAGLLLLDGAASVPEAESLIARHRRPEPQLAAGAALTRAGASAMIDLSDGLAADARHLADRSGCMVTIDLARLPIAPGVAAVAESAGLDPLELAAGAGDDYELLVTAPPERAGALERAAADAGVSLTHLGRAEAGTGVVLRAAGGRRLELTGYEHE
jgi:thiamine-monophosphate kinase